MQGGMLQTLLLMIRIPPKWHKPLLRKRGQIAYLPLPFGSSFPMNLGRGWQVVQ